VEFCFKFESSLAYFSFSQSFKFLYFHYWDMIAHMPVEYTVLKYCTARNYVRDLEVVLVDGTIIHTGSIMLKSAAGYDLTHFIIVSERMLGIVTKAA